MIDPIKAVRDILVADSGVVALTAHVFGGILPEKFDVKNTGPAIVLTVRGGTTHSEMPVQSPSVQVQCWADVNAFVTARQVYLAVFNALHGLNNLTVAGGKVHSCVEESIGRDSIDPDTGWVQVISAYKLIIS